MDLIRCPLQKLDLNFPAHESKIANISLLYYFARYLLLILSYLDERNGIAIELTQNIFLTKRRQNMTICGCRDDQIM